MGKIADEVLKKWTDSDSYNVVIRSFHIGAVKQMLEEVEKMTVIDTLLGVGHVEDAKYMSKRFAEEGGKVTETHPT